MLPRHWRRAVWPGVALVALGATVASGGRPQPSSRGRSGGPAASKSVKIAFYNIQSGIGAQPLKGHPTTFAQTVNCDPAKGPVNAWGAGVVQKELIERIRNDPATIAFGLAEAWFCGAPKNVRQVLGWKSDSDERNGTGVVARFGFSGGVEWLQLDTSRNNNPKDTAWVVRAAVCLTATCSRHLDVYTTHWVGTGPEEQSTFDRQARATVEFMAQSKGPHVLVGDLNVWEGQSIVCHQRPNNSSLNILRAAGYVDAWAELHGGAEGYTGMVNRPGCGTPDGYVWKRIDYAWSKGLKPLSMARFGLAPAGDAAPSDHLGIIAEYPLP